MCERFTWTESVIGGNPVVSGEYAIQKYDLVTHQGKLLQFVVRNRAVLGVMLDDADKKLHLVEYDELTAI